jgi:hypothetical protein
MSKDDKLAHALDSMGALTWKTPKEPIVLSIIWDGQLMRKRKLHMILVSQLNWHQSVHRHVKAEDIDTLKCPS